jgi:hypothetical protein
MENLTISFDVTISELLSAHEEHESWVDFFQAKAQEKTKTDLAWLQIVCYDVIGHTDNGVTIQIHGYIEEV